MMTPTKLRTLGMTLLTLLLLPSCFSDNNGYPEKIVFDKSGGKLTITGNYPPHGIEITNYDGEGISTPPQKEETMEVVLDWLTVRSASDGTAFDVVATPNDTGKKRKLYIRLFAFDSPADVDVIQKK